MIKKEEITRIKAWMKNKPMPPYQIEIKPTNKCNLRCVTCEAMGDLKYNKNEELTLDIYKKLIEEAAEIKVKNIHLSGGGDPLCSDITPNLMKYIKQKGMEGTVSTNGTLFTENIIKELSNKL